MALFQSINRQRVRWLPLAITLTYPGVYDPDPASWKCDLDAFMKALRRAYPEVSAVWKLEFQQRGAPHYHILAFGAQFIPAWWVAAVWYRVVGSLDFDHLSAGTQVTQVKSWRGVMSYAAKYLGKVVDGGETDWPGRFWGVVNRAGLPVTALLLPLSWRAFYRVRRVLLAWEQRKLDGAQPVSTIKRKRRGRASPTWRRRDPSEFQGLTVLGDPPVLAQLCRLLAE